jgi:lipopolysaccharide/colanic/teichoic acid biosynthesis glycosyltransferase
VAPASMLIAVLIRLDSQGPVIFRQERVGLDGTRFVCLKFRTMYVSADPRVHQQAIQRLVGGERLSDDPGSPYKLTSDPRVTGVGRWLRKTSLDELPQLINVIRGEMSLVGPRPAIPYELEFYEPWQFQRHAVKPGITGLWQVYGRGTMTLDEMFELDVEYARNWTVFMDLRLLLLTVPAVLKQRGAR